MSKTRLKLIIWLFLGFCCAVIGLATVSVSSRLLAFFQRGADPATALNIVPNVVPDIGVKLTLLPEQGDVGRMIDNYTREQLAQAYMRAWLEWNLAYARGDARGLPTAFTGPALLAARATIESAVDQGLMVTQVDLAHRLQMTFYSIDGSVATLTDLGSNEVRLIRDRTGALIYTGETQATYAAVLVFEDGRWRVRQLTRTTLEALDGTNKVLGQPQPAAAMVSVRGTDLVLDGKPYAIAGINYYPQATPWELFWPNYTPALIERDLVRMRSLGLNTVRIFIPYEQFGGRDVRPDLLDRLGDFLDRAHANQLKVIVTLFDFRGDYNPLLWPQSDRHLETILTRFMDHPAILAWDLKNEPDLDYKRVGRETVDLWLAHSLRLARTYDPHHLITIGWSSAEVATTFGQALDLISFHDYLPPQGLLARYAQLRTALPGRPIILGEYGLPTWNSPFFPNGHTEAEQANYYADVLSALHTTDAAGSLAWTLYDYGRVPASVAGSWPWQTGPQQQLGLLHANGTPKPAAALLRPGADLAVAPLPWWARFLKPFWLFLGFLVLLGGRVAWRLVRRRRMGKGWI
ncbi:MAG: cellulase family glycosylhydrolase [Roseiflexaceae bacterium]|nr:cellulase family glycosylhydrolase [Roseiflexaceae bacterium]